MTHSSTPGTLYFITERDPFCDAPAAYVKIGLVRDNDMGRSSDDRLLEHQTGNPRSLRIAALSATAAGGGQRLGSTASQRIESAGNGSASVTAASNDSWTLLRS